jgi:DnaJ homolog subfamily C member 19
MTFLLLGAAAVAWWLWGRKLSYPQLAAAASALAGVWLLTRGAWQVAIPMVMPGVWMLAQQGQKISPSASGTEIEEARRILGVDAQAGAAEIREAHRRLVAKVHPDQGGSAELAIRVNAARDILLAELGKR